jgi:hypothetical protein
MRRERGQGSVALVGLLFTGGIHPLIDGLLRPAARLSTLCSIQERTSE